MKKTQKKILKSLMVGEKEHSKFSHLCINFGLTQEQMFKKILNEWETDE